MNREGQVATFYMNDEPMYVVLIVESQAGVHHGKLIGHHPEFRGLSAVQPFTVLEEQVDRVYERPEESTSYVWRIVS